MSCQQTWVNIYSNSSVFIETKLVVANSVIMSCHFKYSYSIPVCSTKHDKVTPGNCDKAVLGIPSLSCSEECGHFSMQCQH